MAGIPPTSPPPLPFPIGGESASSTNAPISPGVFLGSTVFNLAINAGVRYIDPDLSTPWQSAITLGTSTATFYGLQRLGLIQNYNFLTAARATPIIYGLNVGSSMALDSTLGYLPYVGETFQAGGWLNQLTSSLITFTAPLALPALIYSPSALIGGLAKGALGAKVAAGVAILAIEAGVFALVNQGLGLVDSVIDRVQTTEVDWNSFSLKRSEEKVNTAKMEDYVWEAELREAAHSKLPRPLANFASNHLGFFVKGASKLDEWAFSTAHQNREARRARMRALLVTNFSEQTRSQIAQAVVDAISKDGSTEAPKMDWSIAENQIQKFYHSDPNTKLFYRYSYPEGLIDARFFPAGRNPVEEIRQLKRLIDEDGTLDSRRSDDAEREVKQKRIELIDIAIAVLEAKKKEYIEKFPPNEPANKTENPHFVMAIGDLSNLAERHDIPLETRQEIARYRKIFTHLDNLNQVKKNLQQQLS